MWEFVGINTDEATFVIGGLNVWQLEWQEVEGQRAEVVDPCYGKRHLFPVYTATDGERAAEFAAREFSNGVWGFYVPVRHVPAPSPPRRQ